MILQELILEDWRTFYGKHVFEFSTCDENKVTLFLAGNASGKTNILNAFRWLFYGQHGLTENFTVPKQLVNYTAVKRSTNTQIIGRVTLRFEHQGVKYRAERSQTVTKDIARARQDWFDKPVNSSIHIEEYTNNGTWEPVDQPGGLVRRLLPSQLKDFVFFAGEMFADKFGAERRTNTELAAEMQHLFGLDQFLDCKKVLKKSLNMFRPEVSEGVTDDALLEIRREKAIKENELEEINETIDSLDTSYKKGKENLDDYKKERDSIKEVEKQTSELKRCQGLLVVRGKHLKEIKLALLEEEKTESWTTFINDAIQYVIETRDELFEKNQLPSNIKQDFVKELLEQNKCICGRSLCEKEEPDARKDVTEWLKLGGNSRMEETLIGTYTKVKSIQWRANEFWKKRESTLDKLQETQLEINELEEKICTLEDGMRTSGVFSAKECQENIDKINEKNTKNRMAHGLQESKRAETADALARLKSQQTTLEDDIGDNALNIRREKILEQCVECIEKIYAYLDEDIRTKIRELIEQDFNNITGSNATINIDDKYQVDVQSDDGTGTIDAGTSTGQQRVLGLSFIGNLLRRRREEEGWNTFSESKSMPIVGDAIFASLQEEWAHGMAQLIVDCMNQAVILVQNKDWGISEQIIDNYIGKAYVLPKHVHNDMNTETVMFRGNEYPLTIGDLPDDETDVWSGSMEITL